MNLQDISVLELPLVGPGYSKKLSKLGIETVWDLFHHVPFRFLDFSKNINISDLQMGETATIKGVVTSYVNQYTKKGKPMQIVTVADETGKVNAIWFNQIYLSKTFREGTQVALAGELNWMGRNKAIIAPEYEIIKDNESLIHTGKLIPIYPETAGITSKWLRRRIFEAWKRYKESIEEFLPQEVLDKYHLENLTSALEKVHFPKSLEEFERGKERLAFNELLILHSLNMKRKRDWNKNKTQKLKVDEAKINKFISAFPFKLTKSQEKVVQEILDNLQKDIPMNRILEGDVGSGKTVVAAIAMYVSFLNNKQSILMAPTQILANQHFATLKSLFDNKLKIGIWTANRKSTEEFDILVGTHALLNKKINFKKIGLVVIDEQHKFGVNQRNALLGKSTPHVLTMTATPIPRTVALTFFGDLDLSILNELPKGRQKIVTWVVPIEKRENGYKWVENKIKSEKVQAFVVCPLIEESDAETMADVKAVKSEYEKLQNKFKDLKIGLLHGKVKAKEKNEIIESFQKGKIEMLVTTPVVEVGIDIPNATVMIIEASDRFGLASLHQLRGRVGRGTKKSYCLLMTESINEKAQLRLNAMTKIHSGFELSELDLALRGPGEIYGTKQSGIPELKIASWNNLEMIKTTRLVAESFDLYIGKTLKP